MSRVSNRRPHSTVWATVLLVLVALAISACNQTHYVLREEEASSAPRLFGTWWSAPIGSFRIEEGILDHTSIHIRLRSRHGHALLLLQHRENSNWLPPFTDREIVSRNDKALQVSIVCETPCTDVDRNALRTVSRAVIDAYHGGMWSSSSSMVIGREREIPWKISLLLWFSFFVCVPVFLWKHRHLRNYAPQSALALCLPIVASIVFGSASIANWYGNYLPFAGYGPPQVEANGVGAIALQSVLRACIGWNDTKLFAFQLLFHGISGVFFLGFLYQIKRTPSVAWTVLACWLLHPVPLRLGYSDAAHVVVEALFSIALFCAVRLASVPTVSTSLALMLATALMTHTRHEAVMFVPVLMFASWSFRSNKRHALLHIFLLGLVLLVSLFEIRYCFTPRFRLPPYEGLSTPNLHSLLLQFFVSPSGMDIWFPRSMLLVGLLGFVHARKTAPALFWFLLSAYLLPHWILSRAMLEEGLVGARYFLPVFQLWSIAVGTGAAQLAERAGILLEQRTGLQSRRATIAVGTIVLTAFVLESLPLYRHRYTFDAEFQFLQTALTQLPDGARVRYLRVRGFGLRADPDCCIDLRFSPLALRFPWLRFQPVAPEQNRIDLEESTEVPTYFYESALCHLGETPYSERRNPGLARSSQLACRATVAREGLRLIAQTQVAPVAMWPFFGPERINLRIYEVRSSH